MRRLCVFCGAATGSREVYARAAADVGTTLAEQGIGLVYGGGRLGLMGLVAEAALTAGGEVIGVIPRGLVDRELAHQGLTELHVVATLHERKALMSELSDGFVTLPGGLGTLEELAEVLSWAQLGLHGKPIGLLDVEGYFGELIAFLDRMVRDGFVRREHRRLLVLRAEVRPLLEAMRRHAPPPPRFPAVDPGVEPAA